MFLDPLFQEPTIVILHALAAFAALLMGGTQLAMPKGTVLHRTLGYVWVTVMGGVAISSFWISGFKMVGPFSPIHLLSIFVLWQLFAAIRDVRRGRVEEHRKTMLWLFYLALVLTGLLTLWPGRIMHIVVFGH